MIAGISVTLINATRPMVSYRALALGAGPLEVGLVASAFSIVPVLIAVAVGRWVDRVGEARFIVVAMALIAAGAFLTMLAGDLIVLALSQVVIGTGQIVNLVAGQAMIANRGPRDEREHRFGLYSTVASLGQLVGPIGAALLVGGSIVSSGAAAAGADVGPSAVEANGNAQAPVFLVATVGALLASLLALTLPHRRPARSTGVDGDGAPRGLLAAASHVLRRPGMRSAMLVSITVISSVDVLIAYLPVYGEAAGLSLELVAILLAIRAGASLTSRLFMGRLIDWLGRNRLLAVSMSLAGASLVLVPVTGAAPVLILLMVLVGLGLGVGQPMTIAWVANRSPRAERATALGVRLTGNRGALLVVPTLMGAIAGLAGVGAIFLVLAWALVGGAAVALRAPLSAARESPEVG